MTEIRQWKIIRYSPSGELREVSVVPYEVSDEELLEERLWRELREAVLSNNTSRALRLMYRLLRRHLSPEGDDTSINIEETPGPTPINLG